ncbi:pilin [Suttonella ornithocola]|uniref:pilin n=1 Tax=Suttonella ornithocola TaxID=279832 RepID=UPI002482E1C7|nr:pilin [Suttonella ornithocola]
MPAYQDYLVRTRVSEGLNLAEPAKLAIGTDVASTNDLSRVATTWNAQAGGAGATSKYVNSVALDGSTGLITITYNGSEVGLSANQTITLTPWVRTASSGGVALATALASDDTGVLDWGCSSETNAAATAQGITIATAGSVPSRFAPASCR